MRRMLVRLWGGDLRDGGGWRGLDVRHGHGGRGQRLLPGRLTSTLRGWLRLERRTVRPLL